MPTDAFCSDTFYVHTDPGSLPSFAEQCSFGNCLRIHTTKKMCKGWVTQTPTCVSGARHADFPDADKKKFTRFYEKLRCEMCSHLTVEI